VWDRTRQDIADYVLPRKSDIIWYRTPGARKTWFQFDSTAEHAAHRLASSMLVTVTSPSQKWFALKVREDEINQRNDVGVWLEECADRLYTTFNQSNFAAEISEYFLDLAVFGTSSIFIEEQTPLDPPRFGGFVFKTLQYGGYCVQEGPTGVVDTLYRRFELPALVVLKQWRDSIKKSKEDWQWLHALAGERPDELVAIIHAIYPRDDAEYGKRDQQNMPWASCYVTEKGPRLLHESGFEEFPAPTARWAKASGEIYGRGLGDVAYADIRTLNRYVELDLQAGEKEVDPPLQALEDSVVGEISLRPADITYVTQPQAIRRLVEGPSGWSITKERMERLEEKIRETFHYSELELVRSPQMTATEVQVRWEMMMRLLGATLPRVQIEGLTPLITRSFGLMMRARALPPIPRVLLEMGANIDIQYEGPLSRAQRGQDSVAIRALFADLDMMSKSTQSMAPWDMVKIDDTVKHLADVGGVPPDLIQDEEVAAKIRQQRQQVMQQQHQIDQATQGAQAIGKAAPMLKALQGGQQAQQEAGQQEGAAPEQAA
jgi:hypothetical protein